MSYVDTLFSFSDHPSYCHGLLKDVHKMEFSLNLNGYVGGLTSFFSVGGLVEYFDVCIT